MNDTIIIGASYAGLVAANALLENDPMIKVTIIEAQEDMSSLWIKNSEIMKTDHLGSERLTIHLDSFVSHIETKEKKLIVKQYSGNFFEINYENLILATGCRPQVLKWDDQYFTNAFYVKDAESQHEIYQKLGNESLEKVHILGAGKSGVLIADLCSKLNKDITLIERDSFIMHNTFDAKYAEIILDKLKEKNVEVKTEETVLSLKGNNVVNTVQSNKGSYDTDLVFLGLGVMPNTLLGAHEFKLSDEGAYAVNQKQSTNIDGVYAVGDCALVYDENLETMIYKPTKSAAIKSASVVAQDITKTKVNIEAPYEETFIAIGGINLYSTGITMRTGLSYHVNVAAVDFENEETKLSLIYNTENKKLVGAQIASQELKHEEIRGLSIAIRNKQDYQEVIKDIEKKFP